MDPIHVNQFTLNSFAVVMNESQVPGNQRNRVETHVDLVIDFEPGEAGEADEAGERGYSGNIETDVPVVGNAGSGNRKMSRPTTDLTVAPFFSKKDG